MLQRRKATAEKTSGTGGDASVRIGGAAVPSKAVLAFTVESDVGQPDMGTVRLAPSADHRFEETTSVGDPLTVAFGSTVFSGEVASVEFRYGAESAVVVRGFSLLHRLARSKNSRTFTNVTERQIVDEIAANAKLTAVYQGADIQSAHVYQHYQTDLDFLRTRAARLGSEVWCEGSELHVGPPTRPEAQTVRFGSRAGATGLRFAARLSVDPGKSGTRITGEATIVGDPDLKAGMVVTLDTQDDRFDGKYYVSGVTHRYGQGKDDRGGLVTVLKVTTADRG